MLVAAEGTTRSNRLGQGIGFCCPAPAQLFAKGPLYYAKYSLRLANSLKTSHRASRANWLNDCQGLFAPQIISKQPDAPPIRAAPQRRNSRSNHRFAASQVEVAFRAEMADFPANRVSSGEHCKGCLTRTLQCNQATRSTMRLNTAHGTTDSSHDARARQPLAAVCRGPPWF